MKKVKVIGWMGMLLVMLCMFASCSDKDEPEPDPTPEPTPEIPAPPQPTVSLKEFQEKVVGKFWHCTKGSWFADGKEQELVIDIDGGVIPDTYDFLSMNQCQIYHNYYGTGKVPGKGWAYSTEDYIYNEKSGLIYFRKNTIPAGEIKWDASTMFVESVSDTELVILTDFNWPDRYENSGVEVPENAWEAYYQLTFTPCTPEEIAKYKEDYVYMEF